jgi:hypothetical protein
MGITAIMGMKEILMLGNGQQELWSEPQLFKV